MPTVGLIWELAWKDLRLFLADRRGVVLCFAVPIVLASVFGAIFQRPTSGAMARLPLLLVVEDDSLVTQRLVTALEASDRLRIEHADRTAAITTLAQDNAGVVLILPPGLGRMVDPTRLIDCCAANAANTLPSPPVLRGRGAGGEGARAMGHNGAQPLTPGLSPRSTGERGVNSRRFGCAGVDNNDALPHVELLHHPASALQSYLVEGLFTEIALRESARLLLAPLLPSGSQTAWQRPFTVERAALHGPLPEKVSSYAHSFCGMSLQYVLFWGMDSGLLLLRERRQGIWRRLRAAPVPLAVLLAGKVVATALVALLQILVTFAFGWLVFGVAVTGAPAGFGLMALTAALLSASTGLLVAGLGGNEARARSIAILAILTLSMLGGLWLPAFLLPDWVQRLSLGLPTTWAVRGLERALWHGMGLGPVLRCAGILLAFCAVFLVLAWFCFAGAEARPDGTGGQG